MPSFLPSEILIAIVAVIAVIVVGSIVWTVIRRRWPADED